MNRRLVEWYDQHASEYACGSHEADLSTLHAVFLDLLGPCEKPILDLGAGAGRDAFAFASRGLRVVAIDPSAGLLAAAAKRCADPQTSDLVRFVRGKSPDVPFCPCSFAGVWACASLLHLPKSILPAALTGVARILVPGGLLFLALKEGATEEEDDQGRFFAYYDEGEVRQILTHHQFQVERIIKTQDMIGRSLTWLNVLARLAAQPLNPGS
jgi:ubiquinone/menaquinone biosynthesis C-methylase UbiE